jgi:hypothetical protein
MGVSELRIAGDHKCNVVPLSHLLEPYPLASFPVAPAVSSTQVSRNFSLQSIICLHSHFLLSSPR